MKKILLSMVVVAALSACSTTSTPTQGGTTTTTDRAPTTSSGMYGGRTAVNPLTDPNNILSQRSVYFDFDEYVVKPKFRDMLSAHARFLSDTRDRHIVIQGNTDNRGTAEYNLALGQRRADAVRKNLNLMGVSDSQIETVSFGKERPRNLNNSEEGWAENRRADIVYNGE